MCIVHVDVHAWGVCSAMYSVVAIATEQICSS